MANGEEEKKLTAAEKGKAKAPAQDDLDGANGTSDSTKDKDAKTGKNADKPAEGMCFARGIYEPLLPRATRQLTIAQKTSLKKTSSSRTSWTC